MIPVNIEQRTPQWHAWRSGGVGASDSGSIAAAIGLLPHPAAWMHTIQELWEIKMGMRPPKAIHNGMLDGVRFEDEAIDQYHRMTGISTSPMCAEMDGMSHIMASLDGISMDTNIVLEAKVPSEEVFEMAAKNIVVPYYEPQCAHQGLVTWGHPEEWPPEAEHHFLAYRPEIKKSHLVVRKASQYRELAEQLLPAINGFWGHIQRKSAPCGDVWMQAAIRYRIALADLKNAKKNSDLAKAALIELMPEKVKSTSGGGLKATQSVKAGKISYSAYVQTLDVDPAVLEEYRGDSYNSVRITVDNKSAIPNFTDSVYIEMVDGDEDEDDGELSDAVQQAMSMG